jgi:hypothetical protein
MTLVVNLADKQSEMFARSQKKRRKQQRLNAMGPRKHRAKTRPPRRSDDSIWKEKMLQASPREFCYLVYARERIKRNEPVSTFQEFYKYKDGEGPGDNPFLRDFHIQEPSVQNPVEVLSA